MEPMLLPWMLNRKRPGSMEITEIPLAQKPKTSTTTTTTTTPTPPKPPQFKLISFCQRDLAEMCRLTLAYAKIPFEEVTLFNLEEFIKFKTEAGPLNLPMLNWNGKMIHGNEAIGRMLAKMYGLAGAGIFEQAQADSIIGIVEDLHHAIIEYTKHAFGVQKINKDKVYKESFEPGVKKYFAMLEKYASQGPEDGFFFSSGVTYADFAVANIFQLVACMHTELLINFKNVARIAQRVFALPQLQTYLASRPTMNELIQKIPAMKTNFEDHAKLDPEKQKQIEFIQPCSNVCQRYPFVG